jgi:DNA-binding transcriptional ArsR family regulator
MRVIAELQPVPAWTHCLADDAAVFEQVAVGLGSLYDHLLGPYWKQFEDLFTADRTARVHEWLSGGIERVLAQMNPRWSRWNSPVLEIRMPNGADHDLVLEGQGILLLPSVFCTRSIVDDEASPQPIVTYPAGPDDPLRRLTVLTAEPAKARATGTVATLLGHTRSCVLHVIAEHPGCSTKELADLAGIAPASASEHATVLREAGLIQTVRHRNTARHSPIDLGINLLQTT